MRYKTIECIHFNGETPCRLHSDCAGRDCADYKEYGTRIIIIKLDAIGDVLRTTPVLSEIKKAYPDCHITWVSSCASREVLDTNPYIHRVVSTAYEEIFALTEEKFDVLFSLDKAPVALALANKICAEHKIGFCLNHYGALAYMNDESEYAFRLGFNDTLKFTENRQTYQEIIFGMCGFTAKYGEYIYQADAQSKKDADVLFKKWGIQSGDQVVGFNTGAGKVFSTKKWPEEFFVKLARLFSKKRTLKILLLGGPEEKTLNASLKKVLGRSVIHAGTGHPLKLFAEIVGRCDVVVTADTLAMHLAIVKKTNVVALFGPTTPHEVDLYGRGIKLCKDVPCSPCYRSVCDDRHCMSSISPEDVYGACEILLIKGERAK